MPALSLEDRAKGALMGARIGTTTWITSTPIMARGSVTTGR